MIVRLMGGLGNQMFQYAMGKMLEAQKGETFYIDVFSFYRDKKRKYELNCFDIKERKASFFYLLYYNIFFYLGSDEKRNQKICYESEIFRYQDVCCAPQKYFVGSWQHEAYFEKIRNELQSDFTFRDKFSPNIEKMAQIISEKEAVLIHVRRGDYLDCADYEIVGAEYYAEAMRYIRDKIPSAEFFVFSDDIEWCRRHFAKEDNIVFIAGNTGKEDFYLMCKCKHFIIANSTFSWWAAWLSDKESMKIAPARWFKDEKTNEKVADALLKEFYVMNISSK